MKLTNNQAIIWSKEYQMMAVLRADIVFRIKEYKIY